MCYGGTGVQSDCVLEHMDLDKGDSKERRERASKVLETYNLKETS